MLDEVMTTRSSDVVVERFAGPAPAQAPLEVVEHKGPGHPDTLCDRAAEEACRALCRLYEARAGRVLHHNVDKCALVGGRAAPRFGGGELLEPIRLLVIGRATDQSGADRLPIVDAVRAATRDWLPRAVRHLDPERDVTIECLLRPGAAELKRLVAGGTPRCNDTSIGVGHFPPTPCETAALAVAAALVAPAFQARVPAAGEDVKIMAVRRARHLSLTVSCALVARWLPDAEAYRAAREAVRVAAVAAARAAAPDLEVEGVVNAADDERASAFFLTVTGTSAEQGDDGLTGRGNRVGGLITPLRAMSLEAAAGKNPVSHVGKLYNVVAGEVARMLVTTLSGVASATVVLVSRIGDPLDEPQATLVRVHGDLAEDELRRTAVGCVGAALARLPEITSEIAGDIIGSSERRPGRCPGAPGGEGSMIRARLPSATGGIHDGRLPRSATGRSGRVSTSRRRRRLSRRRGRGRVRLP
jgi:S-adenosylmethionine synthetase